MRPLRKVPVVSTTAPAPSRRPSARATPQTRPSATIRSSTPPSTTSRLAVSRIAACMACRYNLRSAWARGPWTAGPLERFRSRNWMPAASATRPMRPSSASISRTRWPLPSPPMAGLQDISPMVAKVWVTRAVRAPMRAAAAAASQPAWPPPTTITSNVSSVISRPAGLQPGACTRSRLGPSKRCRELVPRDRQQKTRLPGGATGLRLGLGRLVCKRLATSELSAAAYANLTGIRRSLPLSTGFT